MKFLSRIFCRFGFITLANKKKTPGFLFLRSNRTFYMTFVLSILFHGGLIYTIPAVDLFSEGPDMTSSEPIVVDFLEEDLSDSISEEAPEDKDNQFFTPHPTVSDIHEEAPVELPAEDIVTESITEDDEIDMSLPDIKESDELTETTTLFSQLNSREPKIESLHKRQTKESEPLAYPQSPGQQQSEKLPSAPIQLQRHIEVDEQFKAPIRPFRNQRDPRPDRPEKSPQFPLHVSQEQPQRPERQDVPKTQFQFGKRRVIAMKSTFSPFDSLPDLGSAGTKKRTLGLSKDDETDKNRFGIFAGSRFEDEVIKKDMQAATLEKENQEAAILAENIPKAKTLLFENQIEGPVKGRKIIRQPGPPKVNIAIEVELQLKFWVLPDGTIGEVIPIKRGDAQLERIAIAYLKHWRFEPLAPEVPQQNIWGIIPIRFTVQ